MFDLSSILLTFTGSKFFMTFLLSFFVFRFIYGIWKRRNPEMAVSLEGTLFDAVPYVIVILISVMISLIIWG